MANTKTLCDQAPLKASPIHDRYFSWAVWLFLAIITFVVFVFPFSGVLGILVFPVLLVAGASSAIGLVRALMNHQLRRAVSMTLLLIFVGSVFVAPRLFSHSIGRAGNVVRLLSEKSEFESKFQGAPPGQKPFWAFDWSVFVTNSTFVVYDASGRIALPSSDSAWNSEDMERFKMCANQVVRIYGYYYRCDI
jgi:membrane-bound ClpP family serine protease